MPGPLSLIELNNVPDGRLAPLARNLKLDLSRAGIQYQSGDAGRNAGEKGDPLTIGAFLIGFISSEACKSLIEVLRSYIVREKTLVIKITRPDGFQVEIDSKNIETKAIEEKIEELLAS